LAGFALAELEDGTFALATGSTNLGVHNPTNKTEIQFFTAGPQVVYVHTLGRYTP
jgi:hypothetical protein